MFCLYHNNLNDLQNIIAGRGSPANKFGNSKISQYPVKIVRKNTLHIFFVIPKR